MFWRRLTTDIFIRHISNRSQKSIRHGTCTNICLHPSSRKNEETTSRNLAQPKNRLELLRIYYHSCARNFARFASLPMYSGPKRSRDWQRTTQMVGNWQYRVMNKNMRRRIKRYAAMIFQSKRQTYPPLFLEHASISTPLYKNLPENFRKINPPPCFSSSVLPKKPGP